MNQRDLIPDLHTVANGDVPRDHPRLILPRLLERAAREHRLPEKEEAAAHAIVLKWADMESRGRLAKRSETELQGEFLTEIFGQVLGYTLFSQDRDYWELRPQFPVPGGTADAAIGKFRDQGEEQLRAVVELKGPTVNVDRQRFNGRTPVQQCWDYLNVRPDCPWGIVCNYVGFRLYHRNKTPRKYEHYTLQDLREIPRFREFRLLFGRDGMLPLTRTQRPLLDRLLEETGDEQRKVGEKLYEYYHEQRVDLIAHLREPPHGNWIRPFASRRNSWTGSSSWPSVKTGACSRRSPWSGPTRKSLPLPRSPTRDGKTTWTCSAASTRGTPFREG